MGDGLNSEARRTRHCGNDMLARPAAVIPLSSSHHPNRGVSTLWITKLAGRRRWSITENLTRLFAEVMEVAERRSAEREDFWSRLVRHYSVMQSTCFYCRAGVSLARHLPGHHHWPPTTVNNFAAPTFRHVLFVCVVCAKASADQEHRATARLEDTCDFWQRRVSTTLRERAVVLLASIISLVDPCLRA